MNYHFNHHFLFLNRLMQRLERRLYLVTQRRDGFLVRMSGNLEPRMMILVSLFHDITLPRIVGCRNAGPKMDHPHWSMTDRWDRHARIVAKRYPRSHDVRHRRMLICGIAGGITCSLSLDPETHVDWTSAKRHQRVKSPAPRGQWVKQIASHTTSFCFWFFLFALP